MRHGAVVCHSRPQMRSNATCCETPPLRNVGRAAVSAMSRAYLSEEGLVIRSLVTSGDYVTSLIEEQSATSAVVLSTAAAAA